MARSLMSLLCVRLELAYHMSYCLLHLHIHFDSHTQRRRKANDYFARVGCRSVNPGHYANGLCVNRLDMAAGDKHPLRFSGSMTVIGGFSACPILLSLKERGAGDDSAPNEIGVLGASFLLGRPLSISMSRSNGFQSHQA